MHGSPWRCIRLSLLLDKPCNICFLPWVGKLINIDLFRRKSFGCLTRVVHKSSWAKLTPRHATPQKEINKTQPARVKWNIYFTLLTQHMKAFWSKIAVARHRTRYLFRLTFSRIITIFAILLSQCLFAKRIEKITHTTQTIVCRLLVSVLQTNRLCSAGFCYCLLLLTPNYRWIQVEWSGAFSKHPKEATLWRELRKKHFSPVERWGTKICYKHEQWYL